MRRTIVFLQGYGTLYPDKLIKLNNDTGRSYHMHKIIFLCHQGFELESIPLFSSPLGKLITENIEEWEDYIEESYPDYSVVGGNTMQHYLSPLGESELSWASRNAKTAAYMSLIGDISDSKRSQNIFDFNTFQRYSCSDLTDFVNEIIEHSAIVTPITYIDELRQCLKLYDMLTCSFKVFPLDSSTMRDSILVNLKEDLSIGICTIAAGIERIPLSDIIKAIYQLLDRDLIFIWVASRSFTEGL